MRTDYPQPPRRRRADYPQPPRRRRADHPLRRLGTDARGYQIGYFIFYTVISPTAVVTAAAYFQDWVSFRVP